MTIGMGISNYISSISLTFVLNYASINTFRLLIILGLQSFAHLLFSMIASIFALIKAFFIFIINHNILCHGGKVVEL